jgi:hypothetical protein
LDGGFRGGGGEGRDAEEGESRGNQCEGDKAEGILGAKIICPWSLAVLIQDFTKLSPRPEF